MIIGTGIDIVELERIQSMVEKHPRFVKKILTENEQEVFARLSRRRRLEYIAGRFAAKEAFVKAVGTGISAEYGWHDVEVLSDERGKPVLSVNLDATIHVSISHSQSYAIAQVILERLSS
ncbi:holo-ACP synthase [Halalkalibacterium halodurans]|uniref:holo-ACP synthase n=1 Tax=Halalkalibacterium halodurans TaxID=86665 RepID=UPI001068BC1B|nr:holo-ACP synthase [Halalkalibacterium halodurans]MDY7221015.1 holo-ACP synthase [Halalkalibacterium halodurans]MDY7240254.1 holo-ACP synthase [Halalkalibacterium halodurans]MED3645883.1 holo-ACP synthase [Halalkalibacterium halodurans]MED4079905.1 holo-ACP synthase [Halalkalibacterium halodurans]MED4085276.1 holo-ACP synthase [Halalkalibacterium halodurans]